LLAVYAEVCRAYHAIDDFRMKLLSLLPLASLVGLLLLENGNLFQEDPTDVSKQVVGFSAIFASALTLALFSYEIRGIRRTHLLIEEGKHLEEQLYIEHGQFHVCTKDGSHEGLSPGDVANSKLAACAIYSLVVAGWLFIALRFGFDIETRTCCLWAVSSAALIAGLTYWAVLKWTSA